MTHKEHYLLICLTLFWLPLQAAPLDTIMSSRHTVEPWHGELELSIDHMNDTLDVFNIRQGHQEYAGTSVGDYAGGHLYGGIALTDKVWLEGSWWDRTLGYQTDAFNLQSWHFSTQYLLNQKLGVVIPDLSVRATLWGNYANRLTKSSSTTLFGKTVDEVDILKPEDNQWQFDLVSTWEPARRTEFTLFFGGGQIRTDFDKLQVSGQINQIIDVGDGVINIVDDNNGNVLVKNNKFSNLQVTLNQESDKISIGGFGELDNTYGVDSGFGIKHDAGYLHLGGSLIWYNNQWRIRGGYKIIYVDRGGYDDLVQQISQNVGDNQYNHIFSGDILFRLTTNSALFVRGQIMTNQFLGEIPFSYTPYTAHRFDEKYGFVSVGINYYF